MKNPDARYEVSLAEVREMARRLSMRNATFQIRCAKKPMGYPADEIPASLLSEKVGFYSISKAENIVHCKLTA